MCRLSVTVRQSMRALLPNRGVKIVVLLTVTLAVFTHTLTIKKLGQNIVAKTRVELKPININAFLNDIIRISAPVLNAEAVYYIYNPNGDAIKLDISSPKLRHIENEQEMQPIILKFVKNMKPIINQEDNYHVFSLDSFDNQLKKMEANDFMIGPLLEKDHGNWVLSVYTKDSKHEWVELFQVISVTITEFVPLRVAKATKISRRSIRPTLNFGDNLKVRIAFPIPDLESCELVAPRSSFDRFFDRTRIHMSYCGYSLPNITEKDAGIWKILAVGKVVYEGVMTLNLIGNSTLSILFH